MIERSRYTSGRIAVANLSASIAALERPRAADTSVEDLLALSNLLFVRGDLLGRIVDHDRAESVANEAIASSRDTARALYVRARLAARFHRFSEAGTLLDRALARGHPAREADAERAALFQATGRFSEALVLRKKLAAEHHGIDTVGALATLLAEMNQWAAAESYYAAALDADHGISPLPCGQLLFEWGVSAMRRGALERAEEIFVQLEAILPGHVPGRGHRAEVALARGHLDAAAVLITPLIDISDDPEYRATRAEILAARGDEAGAACETARAAARYELLLARRPEAYADHAAAFFMGIGNRPQLAFELASMNWKLRDTARSRVLLVRAHQLAAARRMPGPERSRDRRPARRIA